MLLNDLYTIDDYKTEGSNITAQLSVNPTHEIFKGHFPTQPVLPGVCLLEMLKDLIEKYAGKPYTIKDAGNIKYLLMMDPQQNTGLRFEIKVDEAEDTLKVSATSFMENNEINFKFKGSFV